MKRLCVCKILRVLKNALSKQATELLPSKQVNCRNYILGLGSQLSFFWKIISSKIEI